MSRILVATGNLAQPGGSETYVLTIAEHLVRLGHTVTLLARHAGESANLAEAMGIPVMQDVSQLSDTFDGIFSLDREFALLLSVLYPQTARVFIMHNVDEAYLPPPVPNCVDATVALNERHEMRARAAEGSGKVVRLRQPIDTRRFSPRGRISTRPLRVALLGNYGHHPGEHRERLQEAWGDDIEWVEVGGAARTTNVSDAIANVDVVVGYGRSIMEAMSCARAAYVFEHVGSSGWVTPDNYDAMEADGFSGVSVRDPANVETLRADLKLYSPDLGWQGRELIRRHHDAREHANHLVRVMREIAPRPCLLDHQEFQALAAMIRVTLLLSEVAHGRVLEAELLAQKLQTVTQENMLLKNENFAVKRESTRIERDSKSPDNSVAAIYATRRWRMGSTLAAPIDWLRGTFRKD